MKISKVGIDSTKVDKVRNAAGAIAGEVQSFANRYTTVMVERMLCRSAGIGGVDEYNVPLPNVAVIHIKEQETLSDGAFFYLANAMLATGMDPQQTAEGVARGEINLIYYPTHTPQEIVDVLKPYILKGMQHIVGHRERRENYLKAIGKRPKPCLYIVVATGNIYKDMIQAQAAARQGADIIAVIRTTGQSLVDYVPCGATTEGLGGTHATQENFRVMRKAFDEVSEERGKHVRLCNYCSGLCTPEIAITGASEGLDVMLNDALYGILSRGINTQRTIIDQYTSHVINSFADVIINTGEDSYLTTAGAIEQAHMALASGFINERFALRVVLLEEQMGLGHALEMDPMTGNGSPFELAQAQMTREIFPKASLKYMPPTKSMTENIFRGHIQGALPNIVGTWMYQGLQLLGMPTGAIHTPFMSDRFLSIENARYIFNNMRSIGDEVEFKEGGIIQSRACGVLDKTLDLLEGIKSEGLFTALSKGIFADIKRPLDGGCGLDGVRPKSERYYNPTLELMKNRKIQGKL